MIDPGEVIYTLFNIRPIILSYQVKIELGGSKQGAVKVENCGNQVKSWVVKMQLIWGQGTEVENDNIYGIK